MDVVNEPNAAPIPPDGDALAAVGEQAEQLAGVAHPAADAPDQAATSFGRHPVVLYTAKRIVLLLVVGGALYLVGVRGIWLILFAFLVSGFIAMVALKDSREGAAYGITHAVQKVNDRIDASSRAEDYDDLDDDLDRSEPAGTQPAGTQPAETQPAETQPAQTQPAQTQPAETRPAGEQQDPRA